MKQWIHQHRIIITATIASICVIAALTIGTATAPTPPPSPATNQDGRASQSPVVSVTANRALPNTSGASPDTSVTPMSPAARASNDATGKIARLSPRDPQRARVQAKVAILAANTLFASCLDGGRRLIRDCTESLPGAVSLGRFNGVTDSYELLTVASAKQTLSLKVTSTGTCRTIIEQPRNTSCDQW
jgi:hypothetical protein